MTFKNSFCCCWLTVARCNGLDSEGRLCKLWSCFQPINDVLFIFQFIFHLMNSFLKISVEIHSLEEKYSESQSIFLIKVSPHHSAPLCFFHHEVAGETFSHMSLCLPQSYAAWKHGCHRSKDIRGALCAYSSLIYKKPAGSDIAELICSGMPRRAL